MILKSLILIHVTLTVNPDPEVSDPSSSICDPDPTPVIPEPAYHITTLPSTQKGQAMEVSVAKHERTCVNKDLK